MWLGFTRGIRVDSDRQSGGLALLWNEKLDLLILHYAKHRINAAVIGHSKEKWLFTGIYGHWNTQKRINTLAQWMVHHG